MLIISIFFYSNLWQYSRILSSCHSLFFYITSFFYCQCFCNICPQVCKTHMSRKCNVFWVIPLEMVCYVVDRRRPDKLFLFFLVPELPHISFYCCRGFYFWCKSTFFVKYYFHWISVVDADVADSVPGLSECSGGLNDVKVLKV